MRAECVVGECVSWARDDVCDELRGGEVIADENSGLEDGGVSEEVGLDLAELDAEAAELDLVVESSEILDVAVLQEAAAVTGAIEASSGPEGMRDEALGGEGGAVEVSAGEAGATDVGSPPAPGGRSCRRSSRM